MRRPARRRSGSGFKLCAAALLVGPLVVSTNDPARDGSETTLFVAGGGGSYGVITRGCDGPISKAKVEYADLGASIDHAFEGPARLGIRAGGFWPQDGPPSNAYINPHAAFDWRLAGVGLGFVASRRSFPFHEDDVEPRVSAHVRFGRLDRFYVSSSWFENVPAASGGGYFDIGLGTRARRNLDLWFGVSGAGPYDGGGVLVKSSWRVSPTFSLALQARLGSSEDIDENAISLGVGYRAASTHGNDSSAR